MEKIQTFSRIMAWLCLPIMLLGPLAITLIWLYFDNLAAAWPPIGQVQFDPAALTGWQYVLGWGLCMIPVGLTSIGFWRLRAFFLHAALGEVFATPAITAFRRFALYLLAATGIWFLVKPALSVVLSWNNGPGARQLSIALSSTDILNLFFGAVFLVVAHVMAESQRLADDNASIV